VSAGIGFAIPVDTLRYEVETLIREGRIVRPVIGVSYLDSSQAKVRTDTAPPENLCLNVC
jgi:S1-C subfamily serine protease